MPLIPILRPREVVKAFEGPRLGSFRQRGSHIILTKPGHIVTALFSDVRGFTSMSEKMSPEEVVNLLNIYLNLQAKVIHQWGGIVDKFVGDEVMAIFEGKGNEINAVRAAVEIQRYCRTLNEARSESGERQIFIGIGCNSGEVVMGNMGSEDHMDYTVIGDSINIAARLCGIALPGQVLVSKAVADEIGECAVWKELAPVALKGKDRPLAVREALEIKGASRRYMRLATDAAVTYCLEGFQNEQNKAVARNISPSGCLLEVTSPIGIGSKLSMDIDLLTLGKLNARATVHHARKQDSACYIGLCFDGMEAESTRRIIQWVHRVESGDAESLAA